MAELLLRVVDKVHPTDAALNRALLKRGDVVGAADVWLLAELGRPHQLPEDLQDLARFAYLTGWRKGEVQTLAWSDVDRPHGRITLRRAHSKNGEPRVLALVDGLASLIERRWVAREYTTPEGSTALSPFVFHR